MSDEKMAEDLMAFVKKIATTDAQHTDALLTFDAIQQVWEGVRHRASRNGFKAGVAAWLMAAQLVDDNPQGGHT